MASLPVRRNGQQEHWLHCALNPVLKLRVNLSLTLHLPPLRQNSPARMGKSSGKNLLLGCGQEIGIPPLLAFNP